MHYWWVDFQMLLLVHNFDLFRHLFRLKVSIFVKLSVHILVGFNAFSGTKLPVLIVLFTI